MAPAAPPSTLENPQESLLSLFAPPRPSRVPRPQASPEPELSGPVEEPVLPDYLGHRKRLKERFAESGIHGLRDYELVELLLSYSIPHRDTKPYAKTAPGGIQEPAQRSGSGPEKPGKTGRDCPPKAPFISRPWATCFGWLRGNNSSAAGPLPGPGTRRISFASKSARGRRKYSRSFSSTTATTLICYEALQEGTVDHTAVYPREILRKALDLNASGILLAHNHPGGSLEASEGDRQLTRQIVTAARAMGLTVHDHLIVTAEGHFSFRQAGLLT